MKPGIAALLLGTLAGAASGETILLRGATIHPVSGPDIANGAVLLQDGKIAAVGASVAAPAGARTVDLTGKHVYPSLLPPVTSLGLVEISAVRATVDTTELGEINPQARADSAMNFDSELLPVARSAGILVAGISPTGGIVSGSAAAMKLDGWTREDAALKAPAAIQVTWPDLSIDRSPSARYSVRIQKKRRDEALQKLEDAFDDARAYVKARAAEGRAGIPRHDADAGLEALRPAIEGRIPVFVVAQSIGQIRQALAFGRRQGVSIVIVGGADSWRLAVELAAAKVPVILDAVLELPLRADEPYDARFGAAGILDRAGVTVAFNDGYGNSNAATVRNLPHQAAAAVAFGFPRAKALEAMTLTPARILGVADRVGSLEPGKDATLIVTDGDILDLRTHVEAAYLDGRPLDLSDKQKRLYERYRTRPKS